MRFVYTIDSVADWARVFGNPAAFQPLIREICRRHGLPAVPVLTTTPGSHAVFRVGEVIVKIFAPDTVGWDCETDFLTELTTMRRAEKLGVPVPRLIASGRIHDRYEFRYLVEDFVHGTQFSDARLTDAEKFAVGRQLRDTLAKLNTPYLPWNTRDYRVDAAADRAWADFSPSLQAERMAWKATRATDDLVYVHADIHADNAIYTADGQVVLLDFADSCIAPVFYEWAALIPGLFRFEKPYLDGFFGVYDHDAVAERLTEGLLLHRFGAGILIDNGIGPAGIDSIADLQAAVAKKIP